MRGTYVLLLECFNDCEIKVGRLGNIAFKRGIYAYIGSGLKNLEKRILRHLKKDKKIKWHIDYLTTNNNFRILKIFIKESDKKEEENVAKELEKEFNFIKNFGNSDCNDNSHLFLINNLEKFYSLIEKLGFKIYDILNFL